ncbi:hypothetical protein ACF1BU_05910 [Streptomyces sp. NPDC014724]|uniref:hypothetical protein n=1 Tax=unclassified Streptomyces TaxID=2593676 RepID=UPI003702F6DA
MISTAAAVLTLERQRRKRSMNQFAGQDRTRDRCRERHGRCDGAAVTLVGQCTDMLDAVDLQIKDAAGRSLPGDVGDPAAVERPWRKPWRRSEKPTTQSTMPV